MGKKINDVAPVYIKDVNVHNLSQSISRLFARRIPVETQEPAVAGVFSNFMALRQIIPFPPENPSADTRSSQTCPDLIYVYSR